MDNELSIALPRKEIELLRDTAQGLGISTEELASKLLYDEINQRCRVPVELAKVMKIKGPEKAGNGDSA